MYDFILFRIQNLAQSHNELTCTRMLF